MNNVAQRAWLAVVSATIGLTVMVPKFMLPFMLFIGGIVLYLRRSER